MIKFKPIKARKLKVFECSGIRGDTYTFTLPTSGYFYNMSQVSVWVEGTLETEFISGDELAQKITDSRKKYREPGNTSLDEISLQFNPFTIRYKCITDTFRYYCISKPDNSSLNANIIRPDKDLEVQIPENKTAFLCIGSIDIGNNTIKNAPYQVLPNSTFKSIFNNSLLVVADY